MIWIIEWFDGRFSGSSVRIIEVISRIINSWGRESSGKGREEGEGEGDSTTTTPTYKQPTLNTISTTYTNTHINTNTKSYFLTINIHLSEVLSLIHLANTSSYKDLLQTTTFTSNCGNKVLT